MAKKYFKNSSYFDFKDISLGINIFSNKELMYGVKGRITGIEFNFIFVHIRIGIVRCDN